MAELNEKNVKNSKSNEYCNLPYVKQQEHFFFLWVIYSFSITIHGCRYISEYLISEKIYEYVFAVIYT